MGSYKLDCAHAFTGPGFAWESALSMTQVKLELLQDVDMHLFIEKGIRGGVSSISHRFAKANNRHLPETFDQSKPTNYIMYWGKCVKRDKIHLSLTLTFFFILTDCNNLYGTAMCDHLPMRAFKWIQPCPDYTSEIILQHPDDDSQGFILEVDLEYPDNLHNEHNCYPLAPERRKITTEELSKYSMDQLKKLKIKPKDSFPKLVPTLYNKEKYVVHYRNLKYYVDKGLKITKIHRILTFEQGAWLKPYIDFNTEKRRMAVNSFEKDFFKLLNNAVYGE